MTIKNMVMLACAAIAVIAWYSYDHSREEDAPSPSPERASDGSEATVLAGRVTKVIDGDTIDVQLTSGLIRVRFHGIDAARKYSLMARKLQRCSRNGLGNWWSSNPSSKIAMTVWLPLFTRATAM